MFLSHIWSESIILTWGVLTSWMDYLNNLHPCIGGKKWCWMQLINASRNGRKFAYCKLQLSAFFATFTQKKKVSQLEFVRAIVYQYVRFDHKTERLNVSIRNLVSKSTNGHYLAKQSQGHCKFCTKNCCLICNACNVRLHLQCFLFISYWLNWTYNFALISMLKKSCITW